MKLRNKKTGEIVEAESWTSTDGMFVIFYESKDGQLGSKESFETLAELNEEWEDYKPAEPLIKDEKIRKVVRAWADNLRSVLDDGEITFYVDKAYCTFQTDVRWKQNAIDIAELDLVFDHSDLDDGKIYTIAELCGEEEK